MKYLLILILLLAGCNNNMGGKYSGRIVEMHYSVVVRNDNEIVVLTGTGTSTETKTVYNSPMFDKLIPGDKVVVECTAGYFPTCYITEKVPREYGQP